MNTLIAYQSTWINRIWQRFYLAYSAFTSDLSPYIRLKNGSIVDLNNQRLIILGDFTLHTTGNLKLTSDKHIILKSGRLPEERAGYTYSIWFNSEEDQFGNPLLDKDLNKDFEYLEEKNDNS